MLYPIGIIKKVFYSKIIIEVFDISKLNQNYKGNIYTCDGINTYICINKSIKEKFVYQITALYEEEKVQGREENYKVSKVAYFEAIPLGIIESNEFEFGMDSYPMIGKDVFLVSEKDFNNILKSDKKDINIKIGEMSSRNNYYPNINIDKLFPTHIGVLGNTGSGKSTTIKKMLLEVQKLFVNPSNGLDKNNFNFFIFDVHDEYSKIIEENSRKTSFSDISIPLEFLEVEDWINLIMPSEATQLPILLNTLKLGNLLEKKDLNLSWIKAFYALTLYNSQQTDAVTKRSKIVGLLSSIDSDDIKANLCNYNSQFGNFPGQTEERFKNSIKNYIKEQIGDRNVDEYLQQKMNRANATIKNIETLRKSMELTLLYEEVRGNNRIRSYCSTLITRIDDLINRQKDKLFSKDTDRIDLFKDILEHEKNAFEILECSLAENNELLFLTSFILNYTYKKQKNGKDKMYNFIFDEAHRYISDNNNLSFNPTKCFEKISKEGRKFGIFMILASQRVSELSKTVLSQCNNFILHRIRNNIDLEQIRKSIPYISDSQLLKLSYLQTGSILAVGDAFKIPMELKVDGKGAFNHISSTLKPSNAWKNLDKGVVL